MTQLREKFAASPAYARVAPFIIFLGLTYLQNAFGEGGRYWFYLWKSLAGAWLLWEMRPYVAEMKPAFSWEALVVGVGVCVMWVGVSGWYPKFGEPPKPWNPHVQFGQGAGMAWFFILVHLLGSSLVVPPLEEVFYRSFLYRWFVKENFQAMPMRQFHGLSFVVTAMVFGSTHQEWLSGILCGFAYQWLVIRKDRLGDAITAHAITNFLLGLWVIWKNDWSFW
jgi:CAAX prenyl protease-like protein